jgi:formylglycine-generating enzyme required for sulfatase activity
MKKVLLGAATALYFYGTASVHANNIQVGTVVLQNQDVSAGANNVANFTEAKFDLSWENAWRRNTGPANWDAAWVFVKYRIGTGNYFHARVSPNAAHHSYDAATSSHAITIQPSADSLGVFVYLSNTGTASTLDIKDLTLRWLYRTNGLAPVGDNDQVTVQVFAVEMVFVPQGSFYLGDGNRTTTNISTNAFRMSGNASVVDRNDAFLITSEGAINFSDNAATGNVWDPTSGSATAGWQAYTLPAGYPKGFQAFYCMKYDVTTRQYVDFFNTLPMTGSARGNRRVAPSNTFNNRTRFSWNGVATSDATVGVSGTNSHGWVGVQHISVEDALSYMDWAALRPMTELEFEKACRGNDATFGPLYPIPFEYAWGNATIHASSIPTTATSAWTATHVASIGNAAETVTTAYHTSTNNWYCNYGFGITTASDILRGPVRAGFFSSKNPFPAADPRRTAGATYYGIQEMSGNLLKLVISTAVLNTSSDVRMKPSSYTGQHGDGELDLTTGRFNQSNWTYPQQGGQNTTGAGGGMNPMLKGGFWRTTSTNNLSVSFRPPATYSVANTTSTAQIISNNCGMATTGSILLTFTTKPAIAETSSNFLGIRAVRTAP